MIDKLLEMHLPHVYRFALYLLRDHHAAQDVAQEAMLRAWKNRRQLRKASSARAWILQITANLCRDRLRRGQHGMERSVAIDVELVGNEHEPIKAMLREEQQRLLLALINTLSPRERDVLYLHTVEQLSHAEIGQITQLSGGAVKVALSRARKNMRAKLIQIEEADSDAKNVSPS